MALDVANGMKHLASLRVMHADLKAENVLLTRAEAGPDRPHGFTAKVGAKELGARTHCGRTLEPG